MRYGLFGFLFAMWMLMLLGGGIAVLVLGPLSISGLGDLDWFVGSAIKAIIAVTMVALWIVILSKLKNWIFKKEIRF